MSFYNLQKMAATYNPATYITLYHTLQYTLHEQFSLNYSSSSLEPSLVLKFVPALLPFRSCFYLTEVCDDSYLKLSALNLI